MNEETDRLFQVFEDTGEKQVREYLAVGSYGERSAAVAQLWLDTKSAESQERLMRESNQTANSAKNAAWVAAIAAIIAAVFAVMAFFLPSS